MKALLVGINDYADNPLRGCVNDVLKMKALVESRYGATSRNIRVLTNEEATRDAILEGVRWLAEGTTTGGTRLFHFSGHGTQSHSRTGEEPDGWDECLMPYDSWTRGLLVDTELGKEYKRFGKKAHLLLIMDSCHSGTAQKAPGAQDVRFRFAKPTAGERRRAKEAKKKFEKTLRAEVDELIRTKGIQGRDIKDVYDQLFKQALTKHLKGSFGLELVDNNTVLIAGCHSSQTSADARFGSAYHGALTHFLLKALKSGPLSYFDLLTKVNQSLQDNQFAQTPQLEASEKNRNARFLNAR